MSENGTQPAELAPVPSAAACSLRSERHAPHHLTTENHHVIPVAWQLFWVPPPPAPFPGKDPDGRGALWDARTIAVCPTCHRNVHFWIVLLMHNAAKSLPPQPVEQDAQLVIEATQKLYGASATQTIYFDAAGLALERWRDGGGSLQALVAAGEWGQA